MARITVVGGGIIGLACAWRLTQARHQVTVLEAAPTVREASWAAAGMLAPHHEYDPALTVGSDAVQAEALWHLGCASMERWTTFAHDLGGAERVDFRAAGGLIPLLPEDAEAVVARAGRLSKAGVQVDTLAGDRLRAVAPGLAVEKALCLPAAQADPRRTTSELMARLGSAVHVGERAVTITGTTVVTDYGRTLEADLVVLASGAWSPDLAALTGLHLPGDPVKGQMLRFDLPEGALRSFVHCHQAYLVPRAGAGLIVGSTMRWSGFDKTESTEDIALLTENARRLLPDLPAEPQEHWTGLRPRLARGLPLIDQVRPGLIVATGHFRNGILLTPLTAEVVVGLVEGRPAPVSVRA